MNNIKKEKNYVDSEVENSEKESMSEKSDENDNENDNDKKEPELKIEDPNFIFNNIEICHYKIINNFFTEYCNTNPENISKMIDIILKKSDISLRILEWFVTKYSKEKNIGTFNIKIGYKAQLKTFKKRYFDPFKRRKKFFFPCCNDSYLKYNGEKTYIYTTIGQLNFFKWAFTSDVIKFVETNFKLIIQEMNTFNKDEKLKKILVTKEKEKEKITVKDEDDNLLKKNKKNKIGTIMNPNFIDGDNNNEVKFILTFD